MTKKEMSIRTMNKCLGDLGWISVNSEVSGILQKNNFYFVMYPNAKQMVPLSESVSRVGVGAEILVHSTSKSWHIEKDGFLLEEGNVSKDISAAYEENFQGSATEKAVKFAESIDVYTRLSKLEILGRESREVCYDALGQRVESKPYEISALGIGTTRTFIANPVFGEKIFNIFREGMVYVITSITKDSMHIMSRDGLESADVPIASLAKFEDNEAILAVTIPLVNKEGMQWGYEPFSFGEKAKVPEEFNDFGLDSRQKVILATAMGGGYNFTALLDNKLSVGQMNRILMLMKKECNCLPLVGKDLSEEHLDFLVTLADNGLPIDGFCEEGVSVESMNLNYSEMVEGIDYGIRSAGVPIECAKAIRRVAFKMHGYQHVLVTDMKPSQLELLDEVQNERFGEAASFLLTNGIAGETFINCTWLNVPVELQNRIKKMFYAPGLNFCGVSWNEWLESNSGRFVTFEYDCVKGFGLVANGFAIRTDENSMYVTDSSRQTIWRAVCVNEKFYIFDRGDACNLL